MGQAVGDKLMYCHEALHLREKLQKAGYKQKVEKWESDSDSESASSDEEAIEAGLMVQDLVERGVG